MTGGLADTRPLELVDYFCGAGGATRGYQLAGFRVTGVDNRPQPNYCGDEFIQADAFELMADPGFNSGFVAKHGSPVCKDHSKLRNATKRDTGTAWMLAETRRLFTASGIPWVIENVAGAPMRPDFKLCGCQFGLPGLRRERWFETSWQGFDMRHPCWHVGETVTVSGHGPQGWEYRAGKRHDQQRRREAMGIDWMNRDELAQAIPPKFTQFVGAVLLEHLAAGVVS